MTTTTSSKPTWTAFARDTLERTSIQSLSKYVTLLNKLTVQLADHLGERHPLFPALTANDRKPWASDARAKTTAWYARERAKRKAAAQAAQDAPAVAAATQAGGPGPASQQVTAESKAKAATVEVLDELLLKQGREAKGLHGRSRPKLQRAKAQYTRAKGQCNRH